MPGSHKSASSFHYFDSYSPGSSRSKKANKAAPRFMKEALQRDGSPAEGLRSYRAMVKEFGNAEKQEVGRLANNRVENSLLPFGRRERAMLRLRRMKAYRSSYQVAEKFPKLLQTRTPSN